MQTLEWDGEERNKHGLHSLLKFAISIKLRVNNIMFYL